jgi:CubicO group peptidase (beta-lactamase class C family)
MSSRSTIARVVGLALLGLASPAMPVHGQDVAALLADYMEDADFSGSVMVTKNGVSLLSSGFGMANLELGVPNSPSTKFRIGSITKQFTAMGILILQDRGRLRVEDRFGDHVPDVPESWRDLTIHQLLTHTSGIMHSWDLPGFAETMMIPASLDGTLARFHDRALLFEPGTRFQYSGVGYFLLAKIIEVVSGRAYAEFLREEIFFPLGMHDTGVDRPEELLDQRAAGYLRDEDGQIRNAPYIYVPILTGGGNLYSTVEDLSRWDRALSARELVSGDAYESLYRPELNSYGYGWRVGELDGHFAVQHGGNVSGFNAYILRIPDEGLCVVVFSNIQPGRARQIGQALAAIVLGTNWPCQSFCPDHRARRPRLRLK